MYVYGITACDVQPHNNRPSKHSPSRRIHLYVPASDAEGVRSMCIPYLRSTYTTDDTDVSHL
jgi:hypothetical protein